MALRTPPHSLEAERSVIASILLDPEVIVVVSEILRPERFYDPSSRIIYEAMLGLYEDRQPIDAVTLSSQLKKMKKLSAVGGATALAELSNLLSTTANVEHHARIVQDLGVKRQLISLSGSLGKLAFDDAQDLADILDEVEKEVFSITHAQSKKSFIHLKEALTESFKRLDELQSNEGGLRGLPTGFMDLDNLLAGLQKSNLVILAARPGMGKTALSVNITQHLSVVAKKKVAYFSLEMSREELVDRLLVGQADIDAWKLKTGRLDQQDYLKLSEAMGVLAEGQMFIDDTPGLSILEMRSRARRLMSEHQFDILIVDYLQLAQGSNKENRVQEVSQISQGLKNIARELKVPVIALSQLSRAIESRGEKSPQLSDLRESGSIEQDADVVMFLYRRDDDIREAVTLKISKHRNGPLGEVELFFKGDRIKFFGMETKRVGNFG